MKDFSDRSFRLTWTEKEILFLRQGYRHMSTAELAFELGRSVANVQAKAFELGLSKGPKYRPRPNRTN